MEHDLPKIRVNRDFDIPYTAGYSIDGQTLYIDRKLPTHFMTSLGEDAEFDKYLIIHEAVEKAIEDELGLTYNEAHRIALGAEEAALALDSVPADEYYGSLWAFVQENQLPENIQSVPDDLDLHPYKEDGLVHVLDKIRQLRGE